MYAVDANDTEYLSRFSSVISLMPVRVCVYVCVPPHMTFDHVRCAFTCLRYMHVFGICIGHFGRTKAMAERPMHVEQGGGGGWGGGGGGIAYSRMRTAGVAGAADNGATLMMATDSAAGGGGMAGERSYFISGGCFWVVATLGRGRHRLRSTSR